MDHVRQNTRFLKTKIPSKETLPLSEKENMATGKKKPSVSRDARLALGSNAERGKGTALKNEDSRVSRELERNARAKKTPFHVHFDEKNIASKSSVASRSSVAPRSSIAPRSSFVPRTNTNSKRVLCRLKIESKVSSCCGRNDPKQVNETTSRPVHRIESKKIEISNELFGKRHSLEEPQIDKQLPPSKIPRRRSRSVQPVQTVTRNTQRSSSADWHEKSFGFESVNKCATLNKTASRPIGKVTVTLGSKNKISDKRTKISTNSPKIDQEKEKSLTIKTTTPHDGSLLPPPPKTPIKMVIRRSKYNTSASKKGELLEPRNNFKEELIPADLLYHGEYHDELPMVERERERRAPQLSGNFLMKGINAEQRRLVIIFIIRLGIHCRYASRIVYQSVKLFDAVMDKISVDTTLIQLNALASLWIVLKRQEKFHKIPSASKMVSLANDLYIGREDLLINCERKILEVLNFNITFADAFSLFTHHLISCERYIDIDISEETGNFLYNSGCYMIDITLLDEQFCKISASLISVTVLELALGIGLDVARDNAVPRWLFWRGVLSAVLSFPQRFEHKAIDSLRVMILRRVLDSKITQNSFNIVYKKYTRSRYGRVSKLFLEQVTRIPAAETIFDP